MKRIAILFLSMFFSAAVFSQRKKPLPAYLEIAPVINSINMVMVHDVISPPAAARYYAYAMLGAYQIVSENNPKVPALASFIRAFSAEKISVPAKNYDYQIAAIYCILETGKNMLPSGVSLQDDEDVYVALLRKNKISEDAIKQSVLVAEKTSAQIINFSKTDHYNKLSAKLRYTPKKGDGYWYPTPPAYLDAVEPNWKTVRPMVIDSSAQFKPVPPVKFSKDTTSAFFRLAKEVYAVSKKPTQEQLHVAAFWDCNPFEVTTSGHLSIGYKKISPGGH